MTQIVLDSAKYGLPTGPGAPTYSYRKWPASIAIGHFRSALRGMGKQVAGLFAVGAEVDGGIAERIRYAAAGGFVGEVVEAAAEYDWMGAFKQMAWDARLQRREPDGSFRLVYDMSVSAKDAEADAQAHALGIELYYAGRVDEIIKLWFALLVENSGPFVGRLR